MILPAQTIRRLCVQANLITPFCERTVHNGRSFGLSHAGYDVRIAENVCVTACDGGRAFRLASTIERFQMTDDLIAFVKDKSSWARQGLTVQNTVIEPGWCGYLTLELTNHSSQWINLNSGDPIAQIVFQRLEEPTESPYPTTGKYQNQEAGPQPARREI
jgi:dCTP deaminase